MATKDDGLARVCDKLFTLLIKTSDGRIDDPQTRQEWHRWVSASSTAGWARHDTLVDWLNVYGKLRGFKRDSEYPDYDPQTDIRQQYRREGEELEKHAIEALRDRWPDGLVIAAVGLQVHSLALAQKTVAAMAQGKPFIVQGVLRNPDTRTHGAPDVLVRADLLPWLSKSVLHQQPQASFSVPAPNLGSARCHYRVVDVKLKSSAWTETENALNHAALSRLLAYESGFSYLLTAGWEANGLIAVRQDDQLRDVARNAIEWMRRLREDGIDWDVYPRPSVPELWPNLDVPDHYGWGRAKHEIAERIGPLVSGAA